MGIEKKGSKGGNHAGGVLHPFDWNAKSGKKLSRKTDLPEKSKQKKKIEGNLPRSLFRILDDYGIEARARGMKESSDCSCASSLTEDSFYTSEGPNFLEPNSTLLSYCQSFGSSRYKYKSYFQDFTEPEDHKVVKRPMKEFKTKILAPESAKFVATVINPGEKTNLLLSSSSTSGPLKIRELKEKAREVRNRSKSDCNVVKNLRERHSKSMISRNGSEDNEEASNGAKSKGKSISLALQAKANVQKREALNSNSKKEKTESTLPSQWVVEQRNTALEEHFLKGTDVLRQNNHKQNCIDDRIKPNSQAGKKPLSSEVSFARHRNSCKPVGPSGKLASEVKDERFARKKRSLDGNSLLKKGKNGKNGKNVDGGATEIVSLKFNAPMARPTDSRSERMLLNSDGNCTDNLEGQWDYSCYSVDPSSEFIAGRIWQDPREETGLDLESWFPSPVSVLGQISISKSCSSFDTINCNSTRGIKIQFHDTFRLYSTNACLQIEGYTDLSDMASSTSAKTVARSWELDYVKELLNDVEPMFMDYTLGKTGDFIKPCLFKKLENQKGQPKIDREMTSRMNRRLIFDCVNECLDLRFRHYAFAGYELWDEGLRRVKRKEVLADEVFKEISGWGAMGHFMVDEIVDRDMTGKNRWLDYEVELFEVGMKIESRVLSVLIDEVVDDVLVLLSI